MSESRADTAMRVLSDAGYTTGSIQDRQYAFLVDEAETALLETTGSVADLQVRLDFIPVKEIFVEDA